MNAKIDEGKLRDTFQQYKPLQAEFSGDVEVYIAFKKAEAKGQVWILDKKTVVSSSQA